MGNSDISQIKVGEHRVGIMGFKQVLTDLAQISDTMTEDEVRHELYARLGKRNYIAPNAKERYEAAFYREFCRFTGKPFEETRDPGAVEIKILGKGCMRCDKLEKDVIAIVSEMKVKADVEHVRDIKEIASYGVLGSPALVINGHVMSVGNIPSKQNIMAWIDLAMKDNTKE